MKMTKVGEKPKVRGRKLPPAALEVTKRFKKDYPMKDLEQLWGGLMAWAEQEMAGKL